MKFTIQCSKIKDKNREFHKKKVCLAAPTRGLVEMNKEAVIFKLLSEFDVGK